MDEYIGIVKLFAGNYAPRNWAFCNGALLSINTNQALFSILGTTYGGDGRTTFALPDFRDNVPVGAGNGPNIQPVNVGQVGGSATVQLNVQQIPMHIHNASFLGSADAATVASPAGNILATAAASAGGEAGVANMYATSQAGSFVSLAPNSAVLTNAISLQGQPANSQAHNNLQPYLGMSYIICIYGLFPPRN